jgi:hypothetical protein
MKYMVALGLVTPLMIVSSMAQDAVRLDQHVYQGGPKSSIPHATRQTIQVKGAYAMAPSAKRSHAYSGGPQTVVPHSY